jgi:thymidylate synthase
MTEFAAAWAKVQQHTGETFRTVTGREFRYEARNGGVKMLTTTRMLPRSSFEEAFARMPVNGPGALQDLQGPSYLYAILTDPRVR